MNVCDLQKEPFAECEFSSNRKVASGRPSSGKCILNIVFLLERTKIYFKCLRLLYKDFVALCKWAAL